MAIRNCMQTYAPELYVVFSVKKAQIDTERHARHISDKHACSSCVVNTFTRYYGHACMFSMHSTDTHFYICLTYVEIYACLAYVEMHLYACLAYLVDTYTCLPFADGHPRMHPHMASTNASADASAYASADA